MVSNRQPISQFSLYSHALDRYVKTVRCMNWAFSVWGEMSKCQKKTPELKWRKCFILTFIVRIRKALFTMTSTNFRFPAKQCICTSAIRLHRRRLGKMWEKLEIWKALVKTNNVNVRTVGFFCECFSASALDGRLACRNCLLSDLYDNDYVFTKYVLEIFSLISVYVIPWIVYLWVHCVN